MKGQIHIGIIEDHTIVRDGLISLLKEYTRIKVIFALNNGVELLEKLKTSQPDIILLDIEMPVMGGRETFERVKRKYPDLKVIIVSAFYTEQTIIDYVKKGVNSILPKECKIDKLVEAIYNVHDRGTYFDLDVSTILAKELVDIQSNPKEEEKNLSKQDIEIIKLICEDKTSKEIADYLNLSQKTIEFHRSKILRKTNSKNVAALVKYAVQNQLVKFLK